MKKVLAISLMVLMIACMSITAFASPGEFVQSPSYNGAPDLIGGENENEDCDAEIIITPFIDRDQLPEELRQKMEQAYKDIANSKNLADLCPGLSEIAKKLNIPETNLAVSDIFDIRYDGCDTHGEHGKFDIILSSDTFENFAGLMYLSGDGWKLVDGAEVKKVNGEYHLYFDTDEFTTYAVVVNSAVVADKNPHTGDTNSVYLYTVIMAVSAFAVLILLKKNKKQTV